MARTSSSLIFFPRRRQCRAEAPKQNNNDPRRWRRDARTPNIDGLNAIGGRGDGTLLPGLIRDNPRSVGNIIKIDYIRPLVKSGASRFPFLRYLGLAVLLVYLVCRGITFRSFLLAGFVAPAMEEGWGGEGIFGLISRSAFQSIITPFLPKIAGFYLCNHG